MTKTPISVEKPIIFFDGICGLCNRWVNYVLSKDKDGKFLLSPLQGKTAEKLLPKELRDNLSTIVLYDLGKIYARSDAVLRILQDLTAGGLVSSLLKILPAVLLNGVYDLVASTRYRIFGKLNSCRTPSMEERQRFLE